MKTLILDLRTIPPEGGNEWADSLARYEITDALLGYAGKLVKVKITEVRKHKRIMGGKNNNGLH